MRKLNITRTKSGVAGLMKMQVFIEDRTAPEFEISGVPCRKLGNLANGETASFTIDNEAVKVFVIADKTSANICNDFYNIPQGEDDVNLTGKCRYNPGAGNPFRFDGNDDGEVKANRKKNNMKGILLIVGALLLGIVIGVLRNIDSFKEMGAADKDFTYKELTITLTDNFEKSESDPAYDVAYQTSNVVVTIMREDFDLVVGFENYSLKQYGQIILDNNDMSQVELVVDGDRYYFEYDEKIGTVEYHYTYHLYKSDEAFWMVGFITFEEDEGKYRDDIEEYAASVKFE